MSLFYEMAYKVGFRPWEDLADPPPFAGQLIRPVEREEAGREPPYGPALVHGDVTRLADARIGTGYRLVLDTGTFHGLDEGERLAMGREVSAAAARDATVLLDCFAPRHRGPLPRGCSRVDVEAAFPAWEINDTVVADSDPDGLAWALRFDEVFCRLRRR